MREEGYECPYCGYPTTCVRNSISFSRHITRVRMCLTCGKIHETMEMRVDTKKLLAFANRITLDMEAASSRLVENQGEENA